MIEIPGAPIGEEADEAADVAFLPIETPPAAHHKLLIEKLEAVERGEIRRLMVFMPPGSAKSTYASVVFPAWFMGLKKRRNVIVATYASDLARKIGRRMRAIVRQPVFQEIFKTGLSAESTAADEWALDNGNEFMAGGILSGITGNRADGFVVDDPVKNRQDADSEVIQKRTKEEYDATITTRLKPNGWVVLIQTRWNENDLAGQILPEAWDGESGAILCRDGLVWEVLCIPAEANDNDVLGRKPGEMLWPEWFGQDPIFWTAQRLNPRNWSALYQQRPRPDEGTFFQKAWFDGGVVGSITGRRVYQRRRYQPDQKPKHLRLYLTSDHAPTDGPKSDSNGVRVWGVDAVGDVWMVAGAKGRMRMDELAELVIGNTNDPRREIEERPLIEGLIREWRPFAWFPEDDNNWKAVEPFVLRRAKEEQVSIRIEPIPPQGADKAARAQAAQAMAAMGRIHFPEGEDGDEAVRELVGFPGGAHDEEVDLLAIMCRALDMAHPAIVPPEKKPLEIRGVSEMTLDEMMARQERLNGASQRIA